MLYLSNYYLQYLFKIAFSDLDDICLCFFKIKAGEYFWAGLFSSSLSIRKLEDLVIKNKHTHWNRKRLDFSSSFQLFMIFRLSWNEIKQPLLSKCARMWVFLIVYQVGECRLNLESTVYISVYFSAYQCTDNGT